MIALDTPSALIGVYHCHGHTYSTVRGMNFPKETIMIYGLCRDCLEHYCHDIIVKELKRLNIWDDYPKAFQEVGGYGSS